MPASKQPEPQISAKVLGSLFARFTADRDALFAAVERCEERLVDLSERFGSGSPAAAADTAETKADQALEIAQEALEMARQALAAVRQHRG